MGVVSCSMELSKITCMYPLCSCHILISRSLLFSFCSQFLHLLLKSSRRGCLFLPTLHFRYLSFIGVMKNTFFFEYAQSNWLLYSGYCLEASSRTPLVTNSKPQWSHVKCSPRDPRFAGWNPADVDGFFQDVKILSTSPLGRTLSWGFPSLRFQAR